MNVVEKLLKIDAGQITMPTKDKTLKLEKLGGEEVTFTCNGLEISKYNDIQNNSYELDKKGKLKAINIGQSQIDTVLAGVPELKNKELMDHFNVPTPEELIYKILLPGDIAALSNTVSELSGITEDDEDVKEEIKN